MALKLSIVSNTKQMQRFTFRLQTKNLAFATKSTTDASLNQLRFALKRQWKRDFNSRRKNFPFFGIKKAKVNGGVSTSTFGSVFPRPRSADIVTLQSRGGIRRAQSRGLMIGTDRSKWGRNFTKRQRAGQYFVNSKGGKKLIYQQFKRKKNPVVAVLAPAARVGRNFQWEKAGQDPAFLQALQFHAEVQFRKEFKTWEAYVAAQKPVWL